MNKATLTALAFNEPNKLGIERDTAIAAAKAAPQQSDANAGAWRERAARLVTAIEQGGVLEDGPHA